MDIYIKITDNKYTNFGNFVKTLITMKRILSLSAIFAVAALSVCCKSNTKTMPSVVKTPSAGTLTAYYATEDFSDVTSAYNFRKGDLICDDNNEFISILDYDADNYKFMPEEAEDGNVYGAFVFPKSKAEKVVYNQNQLTTELVGDRIVFKDKDGNLATIFKSSRNGQPLYIMNDEKWEFEPGPEELLKKYDSCYVISVHFSDALFEEPLETNGDIIKLYQYEEDAANPVYSGSIEDGWYIKGDWDYKKSAYDENGNLLTPLERTVDIPVSYSVAYIGDKDALYVNGTLYYRVK